MPVLVKKQLRALQAEAFSTHQDRSRGGSTVPVLAFGKSLETDSHAVCARLQVPSSKRERVQLLPLRWGAFPNRFINPFFQIYLFLERGAGSALKEFLEPPMFYLQGSGQCLPLPVRSMFLCSISFKAEGSLCSRENTLNLYIAFL